MMWVGAKEAERVLGIAYETMKKAARRHQRGGGKPGFEYRYIDGKGRGGKVLEIWIEEKKKIEEPAKSAPLTAPCTPKVQNRYLLASKEEVEEAKEKILLVQSFLSRSRGVSFSEWSKERENLPPKGTFYRWVKKYRAAKGNLLDAFLDLRGWPRGASAMSEEMKEMAQRYILRSDIHPNYRGIFEAMRVAYGETLPSYATVCRYIKDFKKKNPQLIAFAENPDRARGKYRAAFGNASAKAQWKNHYWELDGTPADLITADGKRHTIVGAIDVYTRRVVLNVEEKSNSYALARNLRSGILKLGIPETLITDNGRDYTSNHFEEVCVSLGINKQEVPPYSGWMKPHIERFFGTMTRELFRGLEGFCGHNVEERQAIRNRLSFEQKLEAKRRWSEQKFSQGAFAKKMREEGAQIFLPLTKEELSSWLTAWVEGVYERRVHSALGVSPYEKYMTDIEPARTIHDPRLLDILLGEWREYTVGKKGISIRRDGKEATYQHIALIKNIGERVKVALGEDMGKVFVYKDDMSFLCEAIDSSLEGVSREQMRELQREMRKIEQENLKRSKKAQELAQKLSDPTVKEVIEHKIETLGHDPRPKIRVGAQVNLQAPPVSLESKERTINGRPIFESDYEAILWAIENKKEEEFKAIIALQPELYEIAQKEAKRKKGRIA